MGATGTTAGLRERKRVEAVVETLAAIHNHGERLDELAHDARNMVTALSLYCDLLEEPDVLTQSHRHYASELRLVAEASRRLVEKLSVAGGQESASARAVSANQGQLFPAISGLEPISGGLIEDLREELLSSSELLAAIAGPAVTVTATANGAAWPVRMTGENLIRALVNLVKNAAEAIQGSGSIQLRLTERRDGAGGVRSMVLLCEDSGCGIPADHLERVFEPGFSTRQATAAQSGWSTGHRGLGLSITRSIVEAAGGRIHAETRQPGGTRFVLELPVRGDGQRGTVN